MNINELHELLKYLINQSKESEWFEFKISNYKPDKIGQIISALSNSARLYDCSSGYLVFGVKNDDHSIVGTMSKITDLKIGNEEFEHWLLKMLNPKIDIKFYEFLYNNEKLVCIIQIPPANYQPTKFKNNAFIRIGTYTKRLSEYAEKEKILWEKLNRAQFEKQIAKDNLQANEVIILLDTQGFFELMALYYPTSQQSVIEKLLNEGLIKKEKNKYQITNLGAILFAKNISTFESIERKSVRITIYEGKNRATTILKDRTETRGYAIGFGGLIDYINDQLPSNEEIKKAFRQTVKVYPELVIRELIANALIHQDFFESGTNVRIEIFPDRIEITNPGKPLITTLRFIDEYKTRNESLTNLLRRIGICEELGSGIDTVISQAEFYQLPAPEFQETEKHTRVILFSPRKFKEMSKQDKIRACYQHSCLKYVSNEKMTNKSLRERFKIDARNSATVTRIIDATLSAELIKYDDPESTSRKYAKYIPIWA